MTKPERVAEDVGQIATQLRERLGARGETLRAELAGVGRELPRRVRRQAARLAEAEPLLQHPRLRATLDHAALKRAAREVRTHLQQIDPADRRKGWWLGVLAGMAFNVLLFGALVLLVLRWRGFV